MRRVPKNHHIALGLLLIGIVVVAIVIASGTGGTSYSATISSLDQTGDSQVIATIAVTNQQHVAASPTCVVQVYSAAYVAGGTGASGTATFKPPTAIAAGQSDVYQVAITTTSGRASAVTIDASSITCH